MQVPYSKILIVVKFGSGLLDFFFFFGRVLGQDRADISSGFLGASFDEGLVRILWFVGVALLLLGTVAGDVTFFFTEKASSGLEKSVTLFGGHGVDIHSVGVTLRRAEEGFDTAAVEVPTTVRESLHDLASSPDGVVLAR